MQTHLRATIELRDGDALNTKITRVRQEYKDAPYEERNEWPTTQAGVTVKYAYPNRFLRVTDFSNKPVVIFEEVEYEEPKTCTNFCLTQTDHRESPANAKLNKNTKRKTKA